MALNIYYAAVQQTGYLCAYAWRITQRDPLRDMELDDEDEEADPELIDWEARAEAAFENPGVATEFIEPIVAEGDGTVNHRGGLTAAEYCGAGMALRWLREHPDQLPKDRICVLCSHQPFVKHQLTGKWKCKSPRIQPLLARIRELADVMQLELAVDLAMTIRDNPMFLAAVKKLKTVCHIPPQVERGQRVSQGTDTAPGLPARAPGTDVPARADGHLREERERQEQRDEARLRQPDERLHAQSVPQGTTRPGPGTAGGAELDPDEVAPFD